ncbi:hypothetical protein AURDEDRAFT_40660, partial [Auricularia subglabra TFB-10046 SS5]
LLLWLKANLSPEEIRKRLLDPASDFQSKMIAYLDSCHQGHLMSSTINETILKVNALQSSDSIYAPPMNELPKPIPNTDSGWSKFDLTVNDLLCRTNKHGCDRRCFTKGPQCKSRFPRQLVDTTHVDATGYIHVRHDERHMNTINPTLSYLLRCNTDVTCLLSGTSIKAVIAYATDYITKVGLKTPSMFQLIRN